MGKVLILNDEQVKQKINRIAYEIYENNFEESELVLAGIDDRGYQLAEMLSAKLKEICQIRITLIRLTPDRNDLYNGKVSIASEADCKNKVIVVVDDVLNTGITLIHCIKHFLSFPVKKLSTAVLVDRNHKDFPVNVNYVGMKLSTTLKEHIQVEFKPSGETEAYLV